MLIRQLPLVLAVALVVQADVYLQNPRGSNNRLNEPTANRKNANRLFDTQNNNRGGYNVGDATSEPSGDESEQYRMQYFQSHEKYRFGEGQSLLVLEWTNQHGCGGDENADPTKVNCNIVLQYMCQPDSDSPTGTLDEDLIRNGATTNTQEYSQPGSLTESEAQYKSRRASSVQLNRGLHEDFEYYDSCFVRERNRGLFAADQRLAKTNLRYSSAIHTRQNRAGTRRGYECPEERDYYPYWHPSPWKDMAVLARDTSECSFYKSASFNTQPYHRCVEYFSSGNMKPYSRWNTAETCQSNGGTWTLFHNYLELATEFPTENDCMLANTQGSDKYIWGIPHDSSDGKTSVCMVALDEPDCQLAPWSRVNHHGNGLDGTMSNYTWIIPHFPSGDDQRCTIRIRYNISTDDYNPFTTDSKYDGINSPVSNNPYVDIGGVSPLQLAINTAQFGRTFQDRTHVFRLLPRTAEMGTSKLHNLNVRGKRGNIVQTYPAVEYDFVPNDLHVHTGDLIHAQWEGSNTHNNDGGGDGQGGAAGQGEAGTDRNNLVAIAQPDHSYPMPLEQALAGWQEMEVVWIHHGRTDLDAQDLAIGYATAGYYECFQNGCKDRPGNKDAMDADMNNAPASYPGAVLKVETPGLLRYMCSRNNAFTNRSQKGKIMVHPK